MRDFWRKYKKIIGAILIFLIFLIFLFNLDKNDFIVKCFHLNIEFWSAVLGFFGVIITILYTSYQSRKDERKANRPFLVYSTVLAVYPYRVLTSNKDGMILNYIINKKNATIKKMNIIKKIFSIIFNRMTGKDKENNDKCYTLVFPMMVKNIGEGVAFISRVYVEYEEIEDGKIVTKEVHFNNNRDKIIEVNQEKKFYVKLIGFILNDLEKLTLRIDYGDMYHQKYNDGIVLSKRSDSVISTYKFSFNKKYKNCKKNKKYKKYKEYYKELFKKYYIYKPEDFKDALESQIHKFKKPNQKEDEVITEYMNFLEVCVENKIYFVRDIKYDKWTTRNQ